MSIGLYAIKKGMTQLFTDEGLLVPVTVLECTETKLLEVKEEKSHGYDSIVFGALPVSENKLSKPIAGQFKKLEKKTFNRIYEVRTKVPKEGAPETLSASHFENVAFVDVSGKGKGKGFQGVMKRHNFSGGRKTHGSKFHREPGGTGMATFPGRTLKGTKLPGRMGGKEVTVQSLRIYEVDTDANLLYLQGSVPGFTGSVVYVTPAKKKTYAD